MLVTICLLFTVSFLLHLLLLLLFRSVPLFLYYVLIDIVSCKIFTHRCLRFQSHIRHAIAFLSFSFQQDLCNSLRHSFFFSQYALKYLFPVILCILFYLYIVTYVYLQCFDIYSYIPVFFHSAKYIPSQFYIISLLN